jgi:hypothetical protein
MSNPFEVTGYFHEEDDIMSEYEATGGGGRPARYRVNGEYASEAQYVGMMSESGYKRKKAMEERAAELRAQMRIGRADRDRYTEHLSRMFSEEYLDREEFQERADAVAVAKTEDELLATVTDLPKMLTGMQELAVAAVSRPVPEHVDSVTRRPVSGFGAAVTALIASLVVTIVPAAVGAHLYGGLGNTPAWFAIFLFGGAIAVLGSVVAIAATVRLP